MQPALLNHPALPRVFCVAWIIAATAAGAVGAEPRKGKVSLNGHALRDDGGEFIGIGASYFPALRHAKYDRARFCGDLDFLAHRDFNYIRTFSMVGWYPAWESREIAPVTFQNKQGKTIEAWDDYEKQLGDMIDIAYDDFGIRTQLTIFADAQLMPEKAARIAHLDKVLATIKGREHKVILLEVANEAWQNGFPGEQGIADLREFGKYLVDRTDVLVALSATEGMNNAALEQMYVGSAADIATEHFTRDLRTEEGEWLPVCDVYRVNSIAGFMPVSHNEPIGPGSSVAAQKDPIKLVSAAAYAWMSGLPMYVYHARAGIFGEDRFEDMPGIDYYRHLAGLLPGDIANWRRTEGKEDFAPFITEPVTGVVRHLSCVSENEFCTLPIGIAAGGVQLEARRGMTIKIFNPLTGEVIREARLKTQEQIALPQGPQAYLIRGRYID